MFTFLLNRQCLHPKYWLLAAFLVLVWCFTRLPFRAQWACAPSLGRFLYRVSSKIRHVTESNLRACFPEMDALQAEVMLRNSAEELGYSIIETFIIWFCNIDRYLVGQFDVEGAEHMQAALNSGRGVIVLACHYGSVDTNGALLAQVGLGGKEFVGTFRQTDGAINEFLAAVRGKFCDRLVSAGDQRTMVKALRTRNVVWYAPDIEVRNKSSAFVEFMGVQASTTLAPARLAKAGNAVVLPFVHYRDPGSKRYKVKVLAPLDDFPSGDLVADARTVNAVFERMLAPFPERYWWVIKRFKNRPPEAPSIY